MRALLPTDLELTDRQRRFAQLYDGNGTAAARKAGYTGSDNVLGKTAYDLLRNPKIVELIREREQVEISPLIMTRFQRQRFWSKTMLDAKARMHDRLRASELLAKSEGDFVEKVEWTQPPKLSYSTIDFSGIDNKTLEKLAGLARCPADCCAEKLGGAPRLEVPSHAMTQALIGPKI